MRKTFFILFFIFIFLPITAEATDCPFGLVNDPAPGDCRLYRDNNGNDLCDLSEENKTTPSALAETEETNSTPKQVDHRLGLITLVLVLAYLVSLFGVYKKKISVCQNRRFWNWLLLAFFIPTALTSLFLALAIEFGWLIDFGINLGYWHFVFGWAFLLVSVFHTLWHFVYYFKKINN